MFKYNPTIFTRYQISRYTVELTTRLKILFVYNTARIDLYNARRFMCTTWRDTFEHLLIVLRP